METFFRVTGPIWGNPPITGGFPSQGQSRGTLMLSLVCAWINGWPNNRDAVDLTRHCAHYDVIVMHFKQCLLISKMYLWQFVQTVPSFVLSTVSSNGIVDIVFRYPIIWSGHVQTTLRDTPDICCCDRDICITDIVTLRHFRTKWNVLSDIKQPHRPL